MFTDGEIGLKMAYDREIRQTTNYAQGMLNRKQAELDEAYDNIRQLQAALAVEQARNAGFAAIVTALKPYAEGTDITKPTGRRFADGRQETGISLIFNKGFDKRAKELGLQNVESLREQAK